MAERVGFDYFWGFLGGETGQFDPLLAENNTLLACRRKEFYLTTAMVDHGVTWIAIRKKKRRRRINFLSVFLDGCNSCATPGTEGMERQYKGKFDQGWDTVARGNVSHDRSSSGVIPTSAKLTPRDPASQRGTAYRRK